MNWTQINEATILIVDDNPTNLKVLSGAIANSGWEILVATDGETAIEQAEYAQPDLILLDINMPGIDGFETCRRLKANLMTCEIPIIFMTALTDLVNKVQGLSLGAVDYITKPFETEEVLARIKVHLQLSYLSKQLENQNSTLEKKVAERTAELEKANQQLRELESQLRQALAQEKELNQLKSRIITTISHEYRTPLMTIISSTELLENYRHRWDESRQNKHFHRIRNTVQHMTNLINEVLFVNKAEFEKLGFYPTPIDLVKLVHELINDLAENVGKEHKIVFAYEGDFSQPIIDGNLFRQIITNLLSNAIKYSPDGGIVDLKLICQNNNLTLQVKDQGIGIPDQDKDTLFESFNRGSNVGNLPGIGLGLSILKKCVDVHGGKITVDSEVGQGSTFTVVLPC